MTATALVLNRDIEEQWKRVRGRLRAELGEPAFKTWLRPLSLDGVAEDHVVMRVPSGNMKDWVLSRCGDRLKDLWCGENDGISGIRIQVGRVDRRPPRRTAVPAARDTGLVRHGRQPGDPDSGPDVAVAALDPRFTFDNFVVGKTNEFAHAAAVKVAEDDAVVFNPLFLYGGVGLGKTHLMHAIAWHVRARNPGRKVLYISAEKFMYKFIRALRYKDTMAFKEQFRAVDLLMIDDIQFIAGKDATQEEFFHTFNALVDQAHQIVISGDRSPSDLDGMEERLRSRLGWGLVADIHPASYELRLGILEAKAAKFPDVEVPRRVLEFLAHKITSNVRELEGALNRVTLHGRFDGRPVTLESTQTLLSDLLRAQDRRVTIEEIQKKVAERFHIRMADMVSSRKQRAIARPRQIAMYLAKRLTSRSLPEIGRKFGGRDHTTVMHGVRKVEELMGADPAFREDVVLLERMLES